MGKRERTWNEVVKELIHLRWMECKIKKERKQASTDTDFFVERIDFIVTSRANNKKFKREMDTYLHHEA